MNRAAALVLLVLASVALPAAPSAAQPGPSRETLEEIEWRGPEEIEWRGPLRVRAQFPIDLLTLDVTPDQAPLLERGRWSAELLLVHSNTFELTPGYDQRATAFDEAAFTPGWDFNVDGETTRLSARIDWGATRWLQLGLEVPVLRHDEGFLDDVIDDFHETLGLPDNDRDKKPTDVLNYDLLSGSERLRLADSESDVGDVVLRAKLGLVRGERGAVSAIVEAKAPTGDEDSFTGSGEWDYGVTFIGSGGWERHVLHGGLSYQVIGESDALPVELDDRFSAFLAWEALVGRRWSVVTQLVGAAGTLPDSDANMSDGERIELHVGFHYGQGPWRLTVGTSENITTNDNTTDLGVFIGTTWLSR